MIEDGKVKGKISVDKKIRPIEGWNISSDLKAISKEFTNNISYEIDITDLAGNTTTVEINITKATNIKLTYASHNSAVGWTYGYGNYDIAGNKALEINPRYKTEAIAFNVSGNVEKDFLQANVFVHTYWGPGTYARCAESGLIYKYGHNPAGGEYKSMASNDLITLNGKKYFQLGGTRVNSEYYTDINGNNPIPLALAEQKLYGVTALTMKLKDYSQFSILYQVYQNEVGWMKTYSDGVECVYRFDRPISAFRVALVPKSEKQRVIDTWNKDVGTSNFN